MTSRLCSILLCAGSVVSFAGCSVGPGPLTFDSPTFPLVPPTATVSSLTPSSATAGGAAFTLTVTGQNFVSTSTINWNGANRATTEMSDTQLTATITAADIAAVGAAQVTVVSPAINGGTSSPLAFLINGTAVAAVPGYLYVANSIGTSLTMGNISAFSVDPNTGILTPIPGSPFQGGAAPTAVTADLSGRFLYETSNTSSLTSAGDLLAFTIDPSTGALTAMSGSPFNTGSLTGPASLAVDSTGKFLFAADFSGDPADSTDVNSITGFSIDPTTGALTSISEASCVGPPANTGPANALATDPVAGFLFASSPSPSPIVCAFSINSQGMLQPVTGSPYSLGTYEFIDPRAVAVDPSGKFVYTANYNTSDSAAFSITPSTGELNLVPNSPFSIGSAEALPNALVVDPLDRFLYIASSGNISGYSLNTGTGAPSMLGGFPMAAPVLAPTSMAVDPSGKFLFVTNSPSQDSTGSPTNSISVYAINATTGALTPVSGSPFAVDGIPQSLIVTRK